MAAYFAMRIEKGKLTYDKVMSVKEYRQYKEEIDSILIADGYVNLIQNIM